MSQPIDRRTFVQNTLCCAATCVAAMAGVATPLAAADGEGAALSAGDPAKAATIHDWLTQFITEEEGRLDRDALIKLLEQRGRQCCARLDFRQQMIAEAQGSVEKLIELMQARVGTENCQRVGNTVHLIYPVNACVCGWSPKRETPAANDPYCDCSKANNQRLFEVVTGRPVTVEVTDSPRRNGKPCRFVIQLVA